MRRLLLLLLLLSTTSPIYAYDKIQGWCERGGQTVSTNNVQSTTRVQQSYPSCTVTVYATGTTNLSTLFSTSSGGAQANPFTASSTGYWSFYAADGRYDVRFSGGGISSPFTLGDYIAFDFSTGVLWELSGNNLSPLNPLTISTVFGGGRLIIDNAGNLTRVNNIAYSWPALQGAASTVLTNDGSGNLSWAAAGGGGSGITCAACTTNLLIKYNGANGANSTFFDDGTSATIGMLTAADSPTNNRFQIQKNQNNSTNLLITNTTSDTLARTFLTARSGTGSNDISMGVTSAAYSTTGGVSASAGLIYTGTATTAGLTIQTAAGHIYNQPGGTTVVTDVATSGLTVTGNFALSGTTTLNAITYTWPASQSAGTFLTTNGSGTLSWSAVGGGGGGLSGSGTIGNVAVWTAGTALGNSVLSELSSGGVLTTVRNTSAAPNLQLYESDQALNEKLWAFGVNSKQLFLTTRTDADAAGTIILQVDRSNAANVSLATFGVPVTVSYSTNNSNDIISSNTNAGTSARSTFKATSDTGSIYMGVTSSGYTFIGSAQANQGFVATTDAATVNGIVFKTVAGPMLFRPGVNVAPGVNNSLLTLTTDYALQFTDTSTAAVGGAGTFRLRNNAGTMELSENGGAYSSLVKGAGTTNLGAKFTSGQIIGNSTYFDNGVSSTIGTLAASDDATTIRFQVQKDQNQSTNLLVRNNTSDTLARTFLIARSGSGSNDISMGVTSALYSTTGGVSASAGLIYTGTATTAGMTIQTGATNSHIYFQPGGTTVIGDFATTGLTVTGTITASGTITGNLFSGSGASLTALNAGNISSGTLALARGGTGQTGYVTNGVIFYDGGSGFTSTSSMTWNGTTLAATQLTSQTLNSSGVAISFNLPSSTYVVFSTSGFSGTGSTPMRTAVDGNMGTVAISIAGSDTCGSGFRCLRVPN